MSSSREISVVDMSKMADSMVKSNLFGINNINQALSLMIMAQAEGYHPGIGVRDYHILPNGRHSMKADAMLARFQAHGGKMEYVNYDNKCVSANFYHPNGGKIYIEWTMEMASIAKLDKKDNWIKYPRAMLKSRVISEGIRAIYPGVIVGTYCEDEAMEMTTLNSNFIEVKTNNIKDYEKPTKEEVMYLEELLNKAGISNDKIEAILAKNDVSNFGDMSRDSTNKIISRLEEKIRISSLEENQETTEEE